MLQMMIRPTTDPKPLTIQLRVSPEFIEIVNEWRAKQRPILTRSDAIRTLVLLAIDKGLKPKPK
jgi:hypothetical protein